MVKLAERKITYNIECFCKYDRCIQNRAKGKLWCRCTDIQFWCIELNFHQRLPFGGHKFRTRQQIV